MLTAGNQLKCRQCEQHAGNIRKRIANVCEAMVGVILTFEKVNKIQGCRSCARLYFSVIFIRNVFQFCGSNLFITPLSNRQTLAPNV